MMHSKKAIFLVLGFTLLVLRTDAFAPTPILGSASRISSTPLFMAGFGGGSKTKKEKKKPSKMKPRQQWDRYLDLKEADPIRVATRKKSSEETEWLEVGQVKSRDNQFTVAAVIRHRVLMANHARRMFPTQILAKDTLEWGYSTKNDPDTETEWTVVSSAPEDMQDNVEKNIGFKGHPDPSGFYSKQKAGDLHKGQTGYQSMKTKGVTGHIANN